MSVRTYNPSVRVGNWNEDIQLEEDTLKDFLDRRERGELLLQRSSGLKEAASQPTGLSVSRDGKVHIGDVVMLVNPAPKSKSRPATALSIVTNADGSKEVTASPQVTATARNTFVITSCDGAANGDHLHYGQNFYITNLTGDLFLKSDRATFSKCAKKSRHNEVTLAREPSHLTKWKIVSFDPTTRMEMEFSPVSANQCNIVTHVKTNNNLCNESAYQRLTPFGNEYEMSTYTALDSHKAEEDVNHWVIAMNVPGDTSMGSIGPPAEA